MDEWVTWVECPTCGHPAAIGWADRAAVEFDCTWGCRLSEPEIELIVMWRNEWPPINGRA
jgi:hypothetical protein